MAQTKVNDFFTTKKRRDYDNHPAKRRKIETQLQKTSSSLSSEESVKKEASNDVGNTSLAPTTQQMLVGSQLEHQQTKKNTVDIVSVRSKVKPSKLRYSRTRLSSTEKSQSKLTDLFQKSEREIPDHKMIIKTKTEETEDGSHIQHSELLNNGENMNVSHLNITEEVTSVTVIDDHNNEILGMLTPRKRMVDTESSNTSQGPKVRRNKVAARKLSPNTLADSDTESIQTAKKKLNLQILNTSEEIDPVPEDIIAVEASATDSASSGKSHLLDIVLDVSPPPVALSPNRLEDFPPEHSPPRLNNLSQKLKALSKMNGQALINRLKQSGKLKDVKNKLDELDVTLSQKKTVVLPTVNEADTSCKQGKPAKPSSQPAHQRFDHLTVEGVPSLPLPFSYRLVENAFHAMDTVVSMLHNRSEMCTFSKLKAAVQNMTQKNFEEKTVGQIKTVTPDAYVFRQENNIPVFGKKTTAYQLTIEACLPREDDESCVVKVQKNKEGKPTFTASVLLQRKKIFTAKLISRVKDIHQTFLTSLTSPITVSNDKITRWHPRFQLDRVADIPSSMLPQHPEMKVYHTAKDVLEKQKGRLNPRVKEALSKVALNTEKTLNNTKNSELAKPPASSSSSLATSSLKGIPPALLAKIRAKEALKMQESLTRDPAEDSKTKTMGHLPDVIRILRSYFVTEKKPALPLESVYTKLEESYRSGISRRDVERHIHLLKELAPELVSLVEIKRGKYLKLDKNVDVQAVSSRILNLVKSRK